MPQYLAIRVRKIVDGISIKSILKLYGKEFAGLAICNASFPLIRLESVASWALNLTAKFSEDSIVPPGSIAEDSRICRFVMIPESAGFG